MKKGRITASKISSGKRQKPWRVTFPLPSGKRSTRHFSTKDEADLFAAEMGMEAYEPGHAMSLEERAALIRLRRQAQRTGGSGSAVLWALNAESEKLACSVIPLRELQEAYYRQYVNNLRPKTIEHYHRMIGYFVNGQEDRAISDFSREKVKIWVKNRYRNSSSQVSCATPILAMFRWAAEYKKEWGLSQDWLIQSKKESAYEAKTLPFVFSPEQTRALLVAADRELQQILALMAFAGIRPHELCSDSAKECLAWQSIDFTERTIHMPWQVDKTRREAILRDLPENLWIWLEQVPVAQRKGRICKFSYRTFRRQRKTALKIATGLDRWPKDSLRHSFATYNFYQSGFEHTLNCMRHSNKSTMFWNHYFGDGGKKSAEEYFSIVPDTDSTLDHVA